MFFGLVCNNVWVAKTCSTSDVPIPKAKDPKAPCVDVWESPHTIVVPGMVKPCSGPIIWTMPWFLDHYTQMYLNMLEEYILYYYHLNFFLMFQPVILLSCLL